MRPRTGGGQSREGGVPSAGVALSDSSCWPRGPVRSALGRLHLFPWGGARSGQVWAALTGPAWQCPPRGSGSFVAVLTAVNEHGGLGLLGPRDGGQCTEIPSRGMGSGRSTSHHSLELIRSPERCEDTWCRGSYGLACVPCKEVGVSENARGFLEPLKGPCTPRRVDVLLVCVNG